MVPADAILGAACDRQELDHALLIDWIHGFDGDAACCLGHGEDVHDLDVVVVDDFAEQETHDFEGDTGSSMLGRWKIDATFSILMSAMALMLTYSPVSGMLASC